MCLRLNQQYMYLTYIYGRYKLIYNKKGCQCRHLQNATDNIDTEKVMQMAWSY